MIFAAALAAIASSVREHSVVDCDETALLLFRPSAIRRYAAPPAYAALHEQDPYLASSASSTPPV